MRLSLYKANWTDDAGCDSRLVNLSVGVLMVVGGIWHIFTKEGISLYVCHSLL